MQATSMDAGKSLKS